MIQKWGIGGSIIVGSASIFFLSLFLPWVDLGIFSVSGFQQDGYIFFIFFLYPVLVVLQNKRIHLIAGLASAIIAIIFVFAFMSSKSDSLFGQEINAAGSGMYLALLACIALSIGVLLKNKEQK